ncbi:MAG: hypothetical protein GXY38_09130 [Planctomycetes bacterium]|nr:hypothetical protein [Planctomycetota bacterium]
MRILQWNRRCAMLVAVLVVYVGGIGVLLFKTFVQAAVEAPKAVKVSIVDFRPPPSREPPPEYKAKLDELEGEAKAASNETRIESAQDAAAARKDLSETISSLNAADQVLTLSGSLQPSAVEGGFSAEDARILESLAGFGGIGGSVAGGGSGDGSGGPSGFGRGKSLTSRLKGSLRRGMISAHGGNDKTEEAISKALKYLAANQDVEGRWGGLASRRSGDVVAISSLALLAFLGNGQHYQSEEFGECVAKGVRHLLLAAQTSGVEHVGKGFGHAMLTYALAEAYAATGDLAIRPVLEERVRAIVQRQNTLGGFNIGYDNSLVEEAPSPEALGQMKEEQRAVAVQVVAGEPQCDLSMLGWHVQALTAAKVAGISCEGMDEG